MSRNPRLRDWPDRLKRLSVEELREELSYWRARGRFLGHAAARKVVAARERDVERELASRLETDDDEAEI